MVTLENIKELDFVNIYEYYHYIGESYISGQNRQVKLLIADLSKSQRKACYDYIEDTWGNNADLRTTIQKLLID